jgi:hypothetical protein
MDEGVEIKVAKIETSLTYMQADITEIKASLALVQQGLEQSASKFSFLSGSWQTICLIAVVAWNLWKAAFGKP